MSSSGPAHRSQACRPSLPAGFRALRCASMDWGRWTVALPGQCEICRAWTRGALCADCHTRFAAPRPRCLRCAMPLPRTGLVCAACLREPPPQRASIAALDYLQPWSRLIHSFKNEALPQLSRMLAALLLAELRRGFEDGRATRPDLLLPVPLAQGRLRERGHNQAWLLTRQLSQGLGVPARADLLWRVIDTPHQQGLDRARRLSNLQAAFSVPAKGWPDLAGRRVALVDDVMTTGATVSEAARTLRRAGAAEVQVWVLARTPLND